jgi:hypothetical protein
MQDAQHDLTGSQAGRTLAKSSLLWSITQTPNQFPPQTNEDMPDRSDTPCLSSRKARIDCPFFRAAMDKRRPRTCRNPKLESMSDVRRHIGPDRQAHLPFLKQCRRCKNLFLERGPFEDKHGYQGEICEDIPVEDDLGEQWRQLYKLACEKLGRLDGNRRRRE